MIGVACVLAYLLLVYLCPFYLWRSFFVVMGASISNKEIGLRCKIRLLWHLAKELLCAPVYTIMWYLDIVIFPIYRRQELKRPVFIVSQPRSGTTFLLRTLSSDSDTFFSLNHFEWRFPFIALWKIVDLFGLRDCIESIDYWPSTEVGRMASKIHHHKLGSVEEHGIFFEERMYHHYFSFRRFPFNSVLERIEKVDELSHGERRKLIRTFRQVVQKVGYYRGNGRIWLTKENESVDLYRLVDTSFLDARYVVIARPPQEFVRSYVTMSKICTLAKHGIDPVRLTGWNQVNMQFRIKECTKLVEFAAALKARRNATFITFDKFTNNIKETVEYIYQDVGLEISDGFSGKLDNLQKKQNSRDSGYSNAPHSVEGFEAYGKFVENIADAVR